MTLINKGVLVTEIKKRIDELWNLIPDGKKVLQDNTTKDDVFTLGKYTALESFLRFIDSLSEESEQNPIIMYGLNGNVGLEDAVKERELYKDYQGDPERQEEFMDFAKFGNQYKESASKDLEEEIENFFSDWLIDLGEKKIYSQIARHFAEWQHGKDFDDLLQSEMKFPKEYYEKGRFDMREEMMKDAVECVFGSYLTTGLEKYFPNFKIGDKVKIIVTKENN